MKNQAPGILEGILTHIISIVFKIVQQFQKGARLQRSVDIYSGVLFDCTLWASRALAYNGRNLWIVDLCSVDLCSWNWKGVGTSDRHAVDVRCIFKA